MKLPTAIYRPTVMRSVGTVLIVLVTALGNRQVTAQEVATLDRETQHKLKQVASSLSEAMKAEDEAEIRRQVERSIKLLGDQAGLPETPDEYREIPQNARPLTASELPTAFDPYVPTSSE